MMGLCSAAWLVLWLVTPAKADTEVFCVFMESCILPCSFQGDTDVIIHWIQVTAGNRQVHSFYYKRDQFSHQDQRFRGRTSLFEDQISGGNASLQLTGLQVQDQGRYKCYTGTNRGNKESYVNLKVEAPVRRVDIWQVENRITCSSERIYPQPELTWSTSPPSNVTHQDKTTRTEQLLYNITSSLTLSDNDTNQVYSCSISTRRTKRRATLFKTTFLNVSNTGTTIPCAASNSSFKSLIWRFNHSLIVLTQTRADVSSSVSEGWRQQVKGVSESGSLMLQNLSPHHEGIYTCELSDAEETLITNTFLKLVESPENSTNVGGIIGGVAVILVIALAVGLVLYFKKKKDNISQINRDRTTGSNNGQIQIVMEVKEGVNEEIPQNDENLT